MLLLDMTAAPSGEAARSQEDDSSSRPEAGSSARLYRFMAASMPDARNVSTASAARAIARLTSSASSWSNRALINRPVLENGSVLHIGFAETDYAALLKK